MRAHLEQQQRAGVLAVRDVGARPGEIVATIAGLPTVIGSGHLLGPPGGDYVPRLITPMPERDLVDTTLRQLSAGASWVKLMADVPGPGRNWFAPERTYGRQALAAVARAVRDAGGRITAHASSDVVAELVAAGLDCVEHATAVTPGLVDEMAQRGTAWVPTLATVVPALEHVAATIPAAAPTARAWLDRLSESLTVAGLAGASDGARRFLGSAEAAGAVTFHDDPVIDVSSLARPVAVVQGGLRIR